jgi:hypothetical protein
MLVLRVALAHGFAALRGPAMPVLRVALAQYP